MLQIARFAMFGGRNMVETLDKSKRSCGARTASPRAEGEISGSPRGFGGPRWIHMGATNYSRTIEQFPAHALV